ncbi:hypothetical protein ACXZ7E_02545 [Paenibacillus lautus]
MSGRREFYESQVSELVLRENEELFDIIDGPYGPIEIIAVRRENSTALAALHRTIAEIMVKQEKRKLLRIIRPNK